MLSRYHSALLLGMLSAHTSLAHAQSMPRDEIRRVVRANIEEVRACHKAHPSPPGTLPRLSFTIAPDGHVHEVKIKDAPQELSRCLQKTIKTWVFSPPPHGGYVTVSYPQ